MKSIIRVFLICIAAQLLLVNPVSALELKIRDEYLLDARGDDGDIYLNRIELNKKIDSPDMRISAFVDSQWNSEIDDWERVLLGLEAGKDLWQYLYIGQSFQLISGQVLDHMVFATDSKSFDTITKIVLRLPFWDRFSFDVFEEYSLNLEEGRDEYNEVGAEIAYRPKKLYSIAVGWRHTDRIHTFDTDYASFSLSLHF
ncbi:MAG: hypothetical protein HQ566_04865 [Candidatus Omnitrophica bacterium]|nr:hypothetical protein [Candidatus Omnitrophota bacterium]